MNKNKKSLNKEEKKKKELENMIKILEQKWSNKVYYTCSHCLKEAYESVINEKNGYVTDEELIKSSNNTLKHK